MAGRLAALMLACSLGCGAAQAATTHDPASITASVSEWSVVPSTGIVAAGAVRLTVRNRGEQEHEVVVVRTATFDERLPISGDHAVAATVGTAVLVGPGEARTVTVRLRPGPYLLLDNLPWHYWAGTVAAFVAR